MTCCDKPCEAVSLARGVLDAAYELRERKCQSPLQKLETRMSQLEKFVQSCPEKERVDG